MTDDDAPAFTYLGTQQLPDVLGRESLSAEIDVHDCRKHIRDRTGRIVRLSLGDATAWVFDTHVVDAPFVYIIAHCPYCGASL